MSLLGKENTDPQNPYADEVPVADLVYSFDWSSTPIGAMSTWPASLKTIVVCLTMLPLVIIEDHYRLS
jgi:hypothetical protein